MNYDEIVANKLLKNFNAKKTHLKSGDIANLIGLLSFLREWRKKAHNKDNKSHFIIIIFFSYFEFF